MSGAKDRLYAFSGFFMTFVSRREGHVEHWKKTFFFAEFPLKCYTVFWLIKNEDILSAFGLSEMIKNSFLGIRIQNRGKSTREEKVSSR